MTYAETERHRHYVSVRDASRYGLLLGPYDDRTEAERHVEAARKKATELNTFASFYGFGTCRVTLKPGEVPPSGRLNHLLPEEVTAERVTCRDCGLGGYRDTAGVYHGDRDVEPCPRGDDDFHHWITDQEFANA